MKRIKIMLRMMNLSLVNKTKKIDHSLRVEMKTQKIRRNERKKMEVINLGPMIFPHHLIMERGIVACAIGMVHFTTDLMDHL